MKACFTYTQVEGEDTLNLVQWKVFLIHCFVRHKQFRHMSFGSRARSTQQALQLIVRTKENTNLNMMHCPCGGSVFVFSGSLCFAFVFQEVRDWSLLEMQYS